MNNPYEELEVSKEFTEKELKSQFRKLAKKHHPDLKKGTSDKFRDLKKAYNILSDPEKRAYYDETGMVFDDMQVNKIKTNAKENLFNLIKQIIYNPNIMNHFENMDLIGIINKAINDNKNMLTQNIRKVSKEYETAKKIVLKLKHKGGENDFIKEMINNSIKEKEEVIKGMSSNIKIFDLMLEMINEYDYDFEQIMTNINMNSFSNLNSTTTTVFM